MKDLKIDIRRSLYCILISLLCSSAGQSTEYTSFDDKLELFQNQLKINRLQYEKSIKYLNDLNPDQPDNEHQANIKAVQKMTEDITNSSNQMNKRVSELKKLRTKKQETQEKIKLYDQANEYKLALEGLIKSISEVEMGDKDAKQKLKSLLQKYFETIFPNDQWSKINLRFFVRALFKQFGTMEQLKATSNKWMGPPFEKLAEHPELLEQIKSVISGMKESNPMLKHFEVENFTQVEAVVRMFIAQIFQKFSTTDDLEKIVSDTIDHYSEEYIGTKVMQMNLKSMFDTYYYMLLTFIGKQQWQDILTQMNDFSTNYITGLAELKQENKDIKAQIKKLKEELILIIDEKLEKMDKDLKLAKNFEEIINDKKDKFEL